MVTPYRPTSNNCGARGMSLGLLPFEGKFGKSPMILETLGKGGKVELWGLVVVQFN